MKKNTSLWIIQGVLALMFLFAGGSKMVMTRSRWRRPGRFSFRRRSSASSACELLGAIGMILPGLTGIKPGLTPLAAAGLVVIMIGATVTNLVDGPQGFAAVTVVLGALAATVAWGRFRT